MNVDRTFRRCSAPGCNRRVMAHLGHELCLLHRGRPKYPRKRKTRADRAKENEAYLRRHAPRVEVIRKVA